MKSTTPSNVHFNRLNRFKTQMATLVSTLALACAVAVPSASIAATRLPDSSYAKLCYSVSTVVYGVLQEKDEKKAIKEFEELMEEVDGSTTFKDSFTEMFYFGLSKRYVYRGEALKSLLQLQCPSVFRRNH